MDALDHLVHHEVRGGHRVLLEVHEQALRLRDGEVLRDADRDERRLHLRERCWPNSSRPKIEFL